MFKLFTDGADGKTGFPGYVTHDGGRCADDLPR